MIVANHQCSYLFYRSIACIFCIIQVLYTYFFERSSMERKDVADAPYTSLFFSFSTLFSFAIKISIYKPIRQYIHFILKIFVSFYEYHFHSPNDDIHYKVTHRFQIHKRATFVVALCHRT